MDYHKLQHMLFEMDPTDLKEDLAKLQAQANQPQESVAPTKDYMHESVEVQEGSLEMDRDYSVADFAALAGVVTEGKQKMGSPGQAKGKDPMPKKSSPSKTGEQPHPLKNKLVGGESINRVEQLEARVEYLEGIIKKLIEADEPKADTSARAKLDHSLRSQGHKVEKDRKKAQKKGDVKHKKDLYNSDIKTELLRRLEEYKK